MSADSTYLDASAFVKLTRTETETGALVRHLSTGRRRVSSVLLRTEALRAAARSSADTIRQTRELLRGVTLMPLDDELTEKAGLLQPAGLRSLDAVHLATALRVGTDLREIVTYDARMAAAAASLGLTVVAPA